MKRVFIACASTVLLTLGSPAAGDVAMTAREVTPVLKALRSNGLAARGETLN